MQTTKATVEQLYASLRAHDAAAVDALVQEHFHEDVVLHEPESLPWGGTHAGRKRVGRMFSGMAAAPEGASPIDASTMRITDVVASQDAVVVQLAFTLTPPAGTPLETGAVEWFKLGPDGRVIEVRAVYFDTAAYR